MKCFRLISHPVIKVKEFFNEFYLTTEINLTKRPPRVTSDSVRTLLSYWPLLVFFLGWIFPPRSANTADQLLDSLLHPRVAVGIQRCEFLSDDPPLSLKSTVREAVVFLT